MQNLEISEGFQLKGLHYLLKTRIDKARCEITFTYFREGEVIFTASRNYDDNASSTQIEEIAAAFHESYQNQIQQLFRMARRVEAMDAGDAALDLMARALMRFGMFHEASALILPHLSNNGKLVHSRFTLAKAMLACGHYKRAREQFETFLASHPDYADAHFGLGICEFYLESCLQAFKAFAKAIQLNPHYSAGYFYIGLTLLLNVQLGQEYKLATELPQRAIKVFRKAAGLNPELFSSKFTEALEAIEQENYPYAFDILFPLSLDLHTATQTDFRNYIFLLRTLLEPETIDPQEAWEEIQRLQKLIPHYSKFPDLHYDLGLSCKIFAARLEAEALRYFQKAATLNPKFQLAQQGVRLSKTGQSDLQGKLKALLTSPSSQKPHGSP